MLGSTQQVGRVLFEKLGLASGRKGKTGYSTDAKVLRGIRGEHPIVAGDRGVAGALEAPQHLPAAAAGADRRATGRLHTTINQTVASTGRLSTTSPNLQSIPIRTELGKEIRSAFIAEEGAQARLGRLLPDRAADPRAPLGRAEAEARRSPAARTSTGRPRPRCSARIPRRSRAGERAIAKMINFGISYGLTSFGLADNLDIPREQAQAYIDTYLARFPTSRISPRDDRAGGSGRVRDDAARPPPAGARAARLELET